MLPKRPHVVVVGAGIVGASLAYHLVRRQARVTLLDKSAQLTDNATATSFGWLTAGHHQPEPYLSLRQAAIADWHRAEKELNNQLRINWLGALSWLREASETERLAHGLLAAGSPMQLLTRRQLQALEPNLKFPPALAAWNTGEGAIDAAHAADVFLNAARAAGATIQLGNEVRALFGRQSRIEGVVTAAGRLRADLVVLAAGPSATSLCQPLGLSLPLTESPAILLRFHTPHRFVNRIVSSPAFELRAASDTLLLAAENYLGDTPENNPQALARRTLQTIKAHWRGTEHLGLPDIWVARRPMPRDGQPVIGRVAHVEGLYLSIMHAGVTLAALVGRLAAAEITDLQADALLSAYRLERFGKADAK